MRYWKTVLFYSLMFSVFILCKKDSARVQLNPDQETYYEVDFQSQSKSILSTFMTNDKARIAQVVSYPLKRPYPIPSIRNEREMVVRFDEVFDSKLLTEIRSSTVASWAPVGWRGTMLNNGTLWLNHDGKIYVINYSSPYEGKLKAELIERERQSLHPSIREYDTPALLMETEKFLVRIDATGSRYRYVSWPRASAQSTKPDLVINNGTLDVQGTMRNEIYAFTNGGYTYTVTAIEGLTIEHNGKTILQQNITRLIEPFAD